MAERNNKVLDRKPFDIQEAVILLDVYLLEKRNQLKMTEAAKIASERLRGLAVRRGMSVSDSFRSPMGLQNRLRCIGGIFEDKESTSASGTEVFREAVALYRSDRHEYQQMLYDAESPASKGQERQSTKSKAKVKVVHTKFVRTKKDQMLKDTYASAFNDVYYALKQLSEKNSTGATGTDVFLKLGRRIMRKDIFGILEGASWSKAVTSGHYVFYDKEREERKKRAMNEALKKIENVFFAWLPSAVPPHALEDVKNSYKAVSSLLVQKKVLSQPLIATTQIGQVENALKQTNRVFGSKRMRNNATKLLSAYLVYLREIKSKQSVHPDLSGIDVQEDWIRFSYTNASQFERTFPIYCKLDGTVVEGKSWARILVAIVELEISKGNPELETLYKKPLYANRADRSFLMKEKIEGLNCSELSNGYWINVNWSIPRLMEIIQAFCLHCGYDKKQIILYGVPKGRASVDGEKKSAKKSVPRTLNMVSAEACLKDSGLQGLTVQELIDAVQPGAAVLPTKNALEDNLNVILMPGNRYVHVDSFVDLDEAEEDIGKILRTHFSQFGGYSNNQLLFVAASQELSMFLNDNDCGSIDAVYAIARYFFEKKAVAGKPCKFYTPHIFEVDPDYPMTLRGLMIHLARRNGGILHSVDAKNYLQKTMLSYGSMGQLLQIGTDNTFLMYDDDRYLLSEAVGIDDAWCRLMHDRMDDLFRKANVAFVIPRDISSTWLGTLPALPQSLEWTRLFLQEILDKYPAIGFKSISADVTQSHHTLAAAFVPIESPLQSFPDVVTLFMEGKYELPRRMQGEELRVELREAGMLENDELIYALPKALDDYRFAWTDENKFVLVLGNK